MCMWTRANERSLTLNPVRQCLLDILMALKDISSLTCHLEVSLEVEI